MITQTIKSLSLFQERGTEKTTLIKSLALKGKLLFGKLGGPYDPVLLMAPTGSASNTIGGFNYLSIFFAKPLKGTCRHISNTDAAKIAGKLTKFL